MNESSPVRVCCYWWVNELERMNEAVRVRKPVYFSPALRWWEIHRINKKCKWLVDWTRKQSVILWSKKKHFNRGNAKKRGFSGRRSSEKFDSWSIIKVWTENATVSAFVSHQRITTHSSRSNRLERQLGRDRSESFAAHQYTCSPFSITTEYGLDLAHFSMNGLGEVLRQHRCRKLF